MHQHWLQTPRPLPNTTTTSSHRSGVRGFVWMALRMEGMVPGKSWVTKLLEAPTTHQNDG